MKYGGDGGGRLWRMSDLSGLMGRSLSEGPTSGEGASDHELCSLPDAMGPESLHERHQRATRTRRHTTEPISVTTRALDDEYPAEENRGALVGRVRGLRGIDSTRRVDDSSLTVRRGNIDMRTDLFTFTRRGARKITKRPRPTQRLGGQDSKDGAAATNHWVRRRGLGAKGRELSWTGTCSLHKQCLSM